MVWQTGSPLMPSVLPRFARTAKEAGNPDCMDISEELTWKEVRQVLDEEACAVAGEIPPAFVVVLPGREDPG